MKTIKCKSSWSKILFLLPLLLAFVTLGAFAQEKKDKQKTTRQKVTIHIDKEVDGKKILIDTTFETSGTFDVSSWIDTRDEYDKEKSIKKIEKEIRVTIPEFSEDEIGSIPETIVVNGDTIFLSKEGSDMKFILKGMPELSDLDIELPELMEIPECPQVCPHHPRFRFRSCEPLAPFMIPELDKWFPFGNIKEIEITKKRGGKKIILRFEENNHPVIIRKGNKRVYHYNRENDDAIEWQPQKGNKIIIKEKDDLKDVNEDTQVDRIKDGDKEVIIIRKKAPDRK